VKGQMFYTITARFGSRLCENSILVSLTSKQHSSSTSNSLSVALFSYSVTHNLNNTMELSFTHTDDMYSTPVAASHRQLVAIGADTKIGKDS
jgi:hypothetical protein